MNDPGDERPSNRLEISRYFHCGLCVKEMPDGFSPQGWGQLECGWTPVGLQVWCKRHDVNVTHVDFEGHQHPADLTARRPSPPSGASVGASK